MTTCYICEINYKDEKNIVGTFLTHSLSNRSYFDSSFCINCLPLVRTLNLQKKDEYLLFSNFLFCSNCKVNYRAELIDSFEYHLEKNFYLVNELTIAN